MTAKEILYLRRKVAELGEVSTYAARLETIIRTLAREGALEVSCAPNKLRCKNKKPLVEKCPWCQAQTLLKESPLR